MDLKIILSLIAAITSLIVAIASLVGSILTSKYTTRKAYELEKLKHEFERKKDADTLRQQQLIASLESSKMALRAIQHMKDQIQLILSAVSNSLDAASAINSINSARKILFDNYENKHTELMEAERKCLHEAKNIALRIEECVHSALSNNTFVSEIDEKYRQSLTNYRIELSDIQRMLMETLMEKTISITL